MLDISFRRYKKLQFSLCGDTKNKTSTEHESGTRFHKSFDDHFPILQTLNSIFVSLKSLRKERQRDGDD